MTPDLAPESVRSAACHLEADPAVVGASALPPEQSAHDAWTIEATIVSDETPGVPARTVALLSSRNFSIADIAPRGSGYRVVAVA